MKANRFPGITRRSTTGAPIITTSKFKFPVIPPPTIKPPPSPFTHPFTPLKIEVKAVAKMVESVQAAPPTSLQSSTTATIDSINSINSHVEKVNSTSLLVIGGVVLVGVLLLMR